MIEGALRGQGSCSRAVFARAALLALICAHISSCVSRYPLEEEPKIHSVQEAASVRVTTLSVARWEDYVDALQPQFSMTADQAYVAAIPQTSISQNSFAEAFGLGLQVGAGKTSQAGSGGSSGGTGSGGSSSSSGGGTGGSGTSAAGGGSSGGSGGSSGGGGSSGSSAGGSSSGSTASSSGGSGGGGSGGGSSTPALPATPTISGPTGNLSSGAIQSYTAATAIYEEVQLLNHYLKDGALRYGYVPYVARLQVSVLPFARNEPYDIYLQLGLFSYCNGDTTETIYPVIAVPLLVTDDIEKGQVTSAENVASQLALSIAEVAGNTPLAGSLSDLRDRFRSILGQDFNSLFMVSRGTDNVLDIRIGAATSPSAKSGYSMLAQTHNVTFLLLVKRPHAAVPNSCKQVAGPEDDEQELTNGPVVQVASYATLREVRSGKVLGIDRNAIRAQARLVIQRFTGTPVSDSFLHELVSDVQLNRYAKFRDSIEPEGLLEQSAALWTGLASVVSMTEYSVTEFNLPYRAAPPDVEEQTVFVHDNCKDTATVTLVGLNYAIAGEYLADLELRDGEYRIAATGVSQSAAGTPLAVTFPSLHTLARDLVEVKNLCSGASDPSTLPRRLEGARLVLRRIVDSRWAPPEARRTGNVCLEKCVFRFNNVVLDGSAQLAQTLGLSTAADSLVADSTGSAKIRLLVNIGKDLDNATLSFNGALPSAINAAVGPATVTLSGGGVKLVAGGSGTPPVVLDLTLQGLVPGRALTVTGAGQKDNKAAGSTPTLVVPILAPPAAAKSSTSGS
jgi:hypothetical protein